MSLDLSGLAVQPWLPVAWGLLVGLVFSLVGAAGGILASFGLISVIGLVDPNQIKPMAQALTLATPLVAVPAYFRQRRLVIPLALTLGLGGIAGALIGSSLSVRYLADLNVFRPVFAFLVLGIAAQLAWSLRPAGRDRPHTACAVAAFEGLIATGGEPCTVGVRNRRWSPLMAEFEFGEEHFRYRPWSAFAVGMGIAILSSALGVGGRFPAGAVHGAGAASADVRDRRHRGARHFRELVCFDRQLPRARRAPRPAAARMVARGNLCRRLDRSTVVANSARPLAQNPAGVGAAGDCAALFRGVLTSVRQQRRSRAVVSIHPSCL